MLVKEKKEEMGKVEGEEVKNENGLKKLTASYHKHIEVKKKG